MNVAVLYENKRNRSELKAAIERKGHEVVLASNTNEFFELLGADTADAYILDMTAWYRGKSIYNYFAVPKKISETPVVFLNVPEGFTALEGRAPIPGDVLLEKDAGREEIAAVIG